MNLKDSIAKLLGLEYSYPSVKKELTSYAERFKVNKKTFEEIDIIIPTYNRLRETKRTLDHLYKTTKIPFKLIIIDNGSTDGTIQYLESLQKEKKNLKVVFLQGNPGASTARSEGLKESKNKFVAFLDNDIITMPNYFENLIQTLETSGSEIQGVQSKVVLPNKLIQINYPTLTLDQDLAKFLDLDQSKKYYDPSTLEAKVCSWIPIGATLWRRELFDRFSFDKAMGTSYEDNDLTFTLYKDGYRFSNCPQAVCLHINSEFAPEGKKNNDYSTARFGSDNVRNSAKHFYNKHGMFFIFGDIDGYCKHLGFNSLQEYKDFIKA